MCPILPQTARIMSWSENLQPEAGDPIPKKNRPYPKMTGHSGHTGHLPTGTPQSSHPDSRHLSTARFRRRGKEPGGSLGTQVEAVRNAIEKLSSYPNDLVAKAIGVSPRTWDRYKSGACTPGELAAWKLSALVASLIAGDPTFQSCRADKAAERIH